MKQERLSHCCWAVAKPMPGCDSYICQSCREACDCIPIDPREEFQRQFAISMELPRAFVDDVSAAIYDTMKAISEETKEEGHPND